jgi:hypothetical protein
MLLSGICRKLKRRPNERVPASKAGLPGAIRLKYVGREDDPKEEERTTTKGKIVVGLLQV